MGDAHEIKKTWLMSTKRKPVMNINNDKNPGQMTAPDFYR